MSIGTGLAFALKYEKNQMQLYACLEMELPTKDNFMKQ